MTTRTPKTPPAVPSQSVGFGQLLKRRRLELELTQAQVAEQAGIRTSYLSMIENHRVDNPPSSRVVRALEQALGLTDGRLRAAGDWATTPEPIRQRVHALQTQADRGRALADWLKQSTQTRPQGGRNLDDLFRSGELQRKLNLVLDPDASASKPSPGPDPASAVRMVPLINKVAAGYPAGFTDLDYPASIADDYVPVVGLTDPDAFAATVCGDSMTPDYAEGDVVVFSPAADVTDDADCFARLLPHHDTTFKRVTLNEAQSQITLRPLNPAYPVRTLPRTQVVGLYRAVFKQTRLGP